MGVDLDRFKTSDLSELIVIRKEDLVALVEAIVDKALSEKLETLNRVLEIKTADIRRKNPNVGAVYFKLEPIFGLKPRGR